MKAEVVIGGAGIAGIAVAYQLTVIQGRRNVVLIDEGPPLALTSDKSTECYRNWWPDSDPAMTALSNRSIDLMEDFAARTANAFALDRRGYLFLSADPAAGGKFKSSADNAARLGSGPLRMHEGSCAQYLPGCASGYADQPTGADLLLGSETVLQQFPYLNRTTTAALHVRRCGALSAQQLGMLMLEQARSKGLELRRGRIESIDCRGGRVRSVAVAFTGHNATVHCPVFINAAGPYLGPLARLLEIELPVICERHIKLTFSDRQAIIPRPAPLLLWTDPVSLQWTQEERTLLREASELEYLLKPFPAGVHGRPVGAGDSVMLYWTYDCPVETPRFPVPTDPHYPEILLRGMSTMIPGLKVYFDQIPNAYMDGGYYTKTPDNRPLIGPLPVTGAWVAGAYSGFGIMIAMAAAELLAAQLREQSAPTDADAFSPQRFTDPAYRKALAGADLNGQL